MPFNPNIPAMGNVIADDVPDIEENFACLGYTNIWVPAGSMIPLDTDGATSEIGRAHV